MPEIQADVEDDDDTFGDFEFIAPPSFPSNSNLIPSEDDEWGDFVENPLQFQAQIPQNPLSFDLFSGIRHPPVSDPPPMTLFQSSPGVPQFASDSAAENRWEKPRGAIPLSIFGEEEAEEPETVDLPFEAQNGFSLNHETGMKTGTGSTNSIGVGFNDLIMNLYGRDDQIKEENGVVDYSDLVVESNDFDENGWEFKDAYSEFTDKDGTFDKEQKVSENWEVQAKTTTNDQVIEVRIQNGDGIENGFNKDLSSVDNFWEFKDTSGAVDCISEQKKEQKVSDLLGSAAKVCAFSTEMQGNAEMVEHSQGTTPFSNGKLDYGNKFNSEDGFFHGMNTLVNNGINGLNSGSGSAFVDLISNLYSQDEQKSTVNTTQQVTGNEFSSPQLGPSSDFMNGDADFGDDGWEFKDAFSDGKVENGNPGSESLDAPQNSYCEMKLKNFVGFYSRLKDEARVSILCHLDDLKKAKKVAALSGEEAKVMALDEEIQAAYEKVGESKLFSGKVHPEEHSPINICIHELLEVLQDPNLQVLETEYHLSKRISLAEKNLSTAVELLEHAISMLQILSLASEEEQLTYVSAWLKMVSACAEELKSGAMIWKQSLQKNFHVQVLSKPQGLHYFLALGEIYRVALVLRVSVALYKPWILSKSTDFTNIFVLLEDCTTSWVDSGLEESLERISDSTNLEYNRTARVLLQSIKSIHGLDELSLHHHVSDQWHPICRLSLLPSGLIQDMKVVLWDGEHYFLKLANLWANRISCDPPQLQQIHVY